jgi:hypothetical protein
MVVMFERALAQPEHIGPLTSQQPAAIPVIADEMPIYLSDCSN